MARTRDLTHKQFLAALERNGFSKPILGGWVEDLTAKHRSLYGLVYWTKPVRLDRRGSLASVIRKREKDRAEAEAQS